MGDDISASFAIAFAKAALRLLADRPGGRKWVLEFLAEELAEEEQDETPEPLSAWMN
jgi:hypothetical protein